MSFDQPGRYGGVGPRRAYPAQWQGWVNLILAIWLFLSPWILSFAVDAKGGTASDNAWVLGILVGAVSIASLVRPARWEEWANLILGLWVFVAPWALGFSDYRTEAWDHWIVGFCVFIVALAAIMSPEPTRVDLAHAGDRPRTPPLD